jgi:hypothetical protein
MLSSQHSVFRSLPIKSMRMCKTELPEEIFPVRHLTPAVLQHYSYAHPRGHTHGSRRENAIASLVRVHTVPWIEDRCYIMARKKNSLPLCVLRKKDVNYLFPFFLRRVSFSTVSRYTPVHQQATQSKRRSKSQVKISINSSS